MPQRVTTVGSRSGLHARPAATFARAAAGAPVPVTIAVEGKPAVAASSLLGLMTLGARHGDTVTLSAEGEGSDAALDQLAELLASDLDA